MISSIFCSGVRCAVFFVGLVALNSAGVISLADAQDAKKKELPKSGTLSSTSAGGYGSKNVDIPWGEDNPAAGDSAPIEGSVSKVSEKEWRMRLFNNSKEDTIDLDVEIAQYNLRGTKTKSDYFSYTLKPGTSAERTINAYANTTEAKLNLRNWKAKKKPAKKDDALAVSAQTGATAKLGTNSGDAPDSTSNANEE